MKSGLFSTVYVLGLLVPGLAAAEPEADGEFLEFLGSWDGADDEWLELMEIAKAGVLEEGSEQVKADIEAESDD